MRALASFVMRGSTQAAMVAAVFAMLALQLPPLSLFSSGAVALVTLRNGARSGALVTGLAAVACALFGLLVYGDAGTLVAYSLILWAPLWSLALLLRASRSLALGVQAAMTVGLVVIAIAYQQLGQPATEWQRLLEPVAQVLQDSEVLDAEQTRHLVEVLASWMTGLLAAGMFLQLVFGLLLGRWWQALLYNPGGFRTEFHQLRMHRALAWVALPLLALTLTGAGADWELVRYLGVLALAAYFLQGLAVVHGVAGRVGAHPGWLVALYLLLFLAMAHAVMALAAVGLTDAWFDYRARIRTAGRKD